ncbi:phosphoesterase family-domain-containing protein [Schizophyllum commune]
MASPSIVLVGALFAAVAQTARAATAWRFAPPSTSPTEQSANYTGFSNDTINDTDVVEGKVFNRFIQIWLENTDFDDARTTPAWENLTSRGLLLSAFHGVTHPSEPNYIASIGGDFWGLQDDDYYHIPENISTVVDLLEDAGITWATYQENMPEDHFYGEYYTSKNYLNSSAEDYTFYMRKHNPLGIYDSVSQNEARQGRIRNFNDFANDIVNGSLSQWIFVTPNMVNDAHDTTTDFAADFIEYWLFPLLEDERFNDDKTIIVLSFDENETWDVQNHIYTLVLGNGLPDDVVGTTDDTFYTHFSLLSTVEANWGLKNLGRNDVNETMANVFEFVARETGYENTDVPEEARPLLNISGFAGPLNAESYIPFYAPDDLTVIGSGGQAVYVSDSLDTSVTYDTLGDAVNLTDSGAQNPWIVTE